MGGPEVPLGTSGSNRPYGIAPCHLAPCPGGDRLGGLPRSFQESAQVFEFNDHSVLDGGHAVGALTLALEVRAVTTRALFGPAKLGFKLGDPRFECGNHVGDRPVILQ
jgi:hypothetical protein